MGDLTLIHGSSHRWSFFFSSWNPDVLFAPHPAAARVSIPQIIPCPVSTIAPLLPFPKLAVWPSDRLLQSLPPTLPCWQTRFKIWTHLLTHTVNLTSWFSQRHLHSLHLFFQCSQWIYITQYDTAYVILSLYKLEVGCEGQRCWTFMSSMRLEDWRNASYLRTNVNACEHVDAYSHRNSLKTPSSAALPVDSWFTFSLLLMGVMEEKWHSLFH